jgi:SAM-dependent methyltransferase
MSYNKYFKLRNIQNDFYHNYKVPQYILKLIDEIKPKKILDYGCGTGQLLKELKKLNHDVVGMDSSDEAITIAKEGGLEVIKIYNLDVDKIDHKNKYDLIIVSHVLEHQKKEDLYQFINNLKYMLNDKKYLLCMVPNAQAITGAYWRYEDFTHEQLFTTGSLYYVLLDNGFDEIKFLDIYATSNIRFPLNFIRFLSIKLYGGIKNIILKLTGNSYHKSSQNIFTYEIKCIAKKK